LSDKEVLNLALQLRVWLVEASAAAPPAGGFGRLGQVVQIGLRVPLSLRNEPGLDFPSGLREYERTLQLSPVLIEIGFRPDIHQNGFTGHDAIGTRSPGLRKCNQRLILGTDHVGAKVLQGPPAAKRET